MRGGLVGCGVLARHTYVGLVSSQHVHRLARHDIPNPDPCVTATAHGEIVVVDGRLGLKITALA